MLHDEGFYPPGQIGPNPGNDGGHRLLTGAEMTHQSGIDIPVTHITGIEYTLQLGSGWGGWPGSMVFESLPPHFHWKSEPDHGCAGTDESDVDNC